MARGHATAARPCGVVRARRRRGVATALAIGSVSPRGGSWSQTSRRTANWPPVFVRAVPGPAPCLSAGQRLQDHGCHQDVCTHLASTVGAGGVGSGALGAGVRLEAFGGLVVVGAGDAPTPAGCCCCSVASARRLARSAFLPDAGRPRALSLRPRRGVRSQRVCRRRRRVVGCGGCDRVWGPHLDCSSATELASSSCASPSTCGSAGPL